MLGAIEINRLLIVSDMPARRAGGRGPTEREREREIKPGD